MTALDTMIESPSRSRHTMPYVRPEFLSPEDAPIRLIQPDGIRLQARMPSRIDAEGSRAARADTKSGSDLPDLVSRA